MKQFWTVLKFELGNYFKSKSFVVTTLLLMGMMIAAVTVPTFFMKGSSKADPAEDEKTTLAIMDEGGVFEDLTAFEESLGQYNWINCLDEKEIEKTIEDEKAEAGFVVKAQDSYVYIVKNQGLSDTYQTSFENALSMFYRDTRLREQGLDPEQIEALFATTIDSDTKILGKNSAQNYAYTYILVFIIYFLIIFYGQMIATSVTSEKSNRAIEILVTSVDSNSLIFGKVIAGAFSGVVQAVLIIGSAVGAYRFTRSVWSHKLDFLFKIPMNVWITYLIFGIFGYLLYAFIFGMLGSLVSKTEDISKSATPVTMIYLVSFFVAILGMNMPDSLMIKIASFIPFTSTNAMLVRVTMGTVSLVEVIISAVILVASCGVVGVLTAKVFRFGTLMYGNPIKLTHALRKIKEQ
ncbi:MAG: ABC transporter permease [Lachnospiraceae bacterium]|nr:ABC transporter permease [Lachnospiraceae bacterium]